MVPVVMRGSGSRREIWRALLKSMSAARWATVFSSSTLKLVRRLSPRALARPMRSVRESSLVWIRSLMPMRIFCWEAPRLKSPLAVPWRARARATA